MTQPRALFETVGGTSAVRLRFGQTKKHRNAAPCVIFSHGQGVTVETSAGIVRGDAVLVGADLEHTVDFRGSPADVIYLETPVGTRDGGFSAMRLSSEVTGLLEQSVDCWSMDAASDLLDRLGATQRKDDPASAELMRRIQSDPMARLSETEAASIACLERTTMLRRFRRQTGMTFRAYKNWTALKHAARLAQQGEPLGSAGLDAGFADAAHFSRRFSAIFGLSPSDALKSLS